MKNFNEFLCESINFPIHEACEKYGTRDYQIVDGKVNVEGEVDL